MKLKRFNELGLQLMHEFLDSLVTETPDPWPEYLLIKEDATQIVKPIIEVEKIELKDRFTTGEYLYEILNKLDYIEADSGLWAWLSLFFFTEICHKSGSGKYMPGERARWIPAVGDFRKYYRHLLAGPYRIFKAHKDNPEAARILLCNSPSRPGDVFEQLASRQEIVTNRAILEAASLLYMDPSSGSIKRGAAGRGPGSARRFTDVLLQFDMNWDLYIINPVSLLNMLPTEFDKFKI